MGFHPPTILRCTKKKKLVWYLGEEEDEPWEGFDRVRRSMVGDPGEPWYIRKPLYDANFLVFNAKRHDDPATSYEEAAITMAVVTLKNGRRVTIVQGGWSADPPVDIRPCNKPGSGHPPECTGQGLPAELIGNIVGLQADFGNGELHEVEYVYMKPTIQGNLTNDMEWPGLL